MSKNLNRRVFFKNSLITSAAVTGALSLEEKTLLAQMKKRLRSQRVQSRVCRWGGLVSLRLAG